MGIKLTTCICWGAYVFEGIDDADGSKVTEAWGFGHIELIREVLVPAVEILYNIATKHKKWGEQDFPGVFEYEVVNQLGYWIGEYILKHSRGAAPSKELVENACENLVNAFFNQGEKT